MSLPPVEDPQVLLYRYQRMKNSPNNWLFWIALFSALNGIFIATSQTIALSAALVVPALFAGPVPHIVAAGVLAGLAAAGRHKWPLLTYAGLGIYALDTLYVLSNNLHSALFMHAIVLGFIAFTLWRTRALERQLAALPTILDPFPKK